MKQNALFTAIKQNTNKTETTNGMAAYKSSICKCLDLFTQGATCRGNLSPLTNMVIDAANEEKIRTLQILFHLRAIRTNGGQGEREVFRHGLRTYFKTVTGLTSKQIVQIIELIPVYGRYDDIIALWDSTDKVNKAICTVIRRQIKEDLANLAKNKPVSLLAKWLPSCNASSKETKRLAKITRTKILDNMSEPSYRKMLSKLRKHLDIIENRLTTKDYTFDYSKVPGKAMLKYKGAFQRNDWARYDRYLDEINSGNNTNAKMNMGTVYPYEIIRPFIAKGAIKEHGDFAHSVSASESAFVEAAWKSLPNYFGDNKANWLAVADVSGSMTCCNGLPMAVSISLAMYIAERNHGIFKDKYISFAQEPKLVELDPSMSVIARANYVNRYDVGYSTNLEGVFDCILDAATTYKLPQSEMPECVVIISDMQFNAQVYDANATATEMIREKFRKAGYEMPKLVYWNVAASNYGNTPISYNDFGVTMINGCKPGLFDELCSSATPLDFMLKVLDSEQYDPIIKIFFS